MCFRPQGLRSRSVLKYNWVVIIQYEIAIRIIRTFSANMSLGDLTAMCVGRAKAAHARGGRARGLHGHLPRQLV